MVMMMRTHSALINNLPNVKDLKQDDDHCDDDSVDVAYSTSC